MAHSKLQRPADGVPPAVFSETRPIATGSGQFSLPLLNQILEVLVIIGVFSVERKCSLKHLGDSEPVTVFLLAQSLGKTFLLFNWHLANLQGRSRGPLTCLLMSLFEAIKINNKFCQQWGSLVSAEIFSIKYSMIHGGYSFLF